MDDSISNDLISADGIVFDCDGVLIDITKSYDLTIDKTVKYVLENFFQITDSWTSPPSKEEITKVFAEHEMIIVGPPMKI